MSFGLGLVITATTTSIAFSIGVIVPYIMGASLGTLTDTLIVAIVLNSRVRVAIVLLLFITVTIITVIALVLYDPFYAMIDIFQERLLKERRIFVALLVSLVVIPLLLVFVPFLGLLKVGRFEKCGSWSVSEERLSEKNEGEQKVNDDADDVLERSGQWTAAESWVYV